MPPPMRRSRLRSLEVFEDDVELPGFNTVLTDLRQAAWQVTPSDSSYYTTVVVLAIEWQHGDPQMNIKPARDKLLQTFKSTYGFDVEVYKIKEGLTECTDAQQELSDWLSDRLKVYKGKDSRNRTLFLLYYSGHGELDDLNFNLFAKPADLQKNKPYRINYTVMSKSIAFFMRSHDDMAALLDCCAAGTAHIDEDVELLGACAWESEASADTLSNFSLDMNDTLASTFGSPKTLADLYCDLYKKARNRNFKNMPPVHRLSDDLAKNSIVLQKLNGPTILPVIDLGERLRVTITVTVTAKETIPSTQVFKDWVLKNIPPGMQDIQFRAGWPETSRLVTLIVPAQIWLFLRDRDAYRFVAREVSMYGEGAKGGGSGSISEGEVSPSAGRPSWR